MRVCIFNIHDYAKLPIVGFINIRSLENEGSSVGYVSSSAASMCLLRSCSEG